MSRHQFEVQRMGASPLAVVVGWDRPCQHFFVIVTDHSLPEDDELVYASMYDPALMKGRAGPAFGGLNFAELKAKLAALGLAVPAGLLERLAWEERRDVGNHTQAWGVVVA